MTRKSIISLVLVLLLTVSCFVIPTSAVSISDADTKENTNSMQQTSTAYNLADNVQDGNILHAFNWHFNDVADYMKEIAMAGFTSVQVSPVQGSKITTNVTTYACDWWALYQPVNFEVGNSLGSKADFEAMCQIAEEHGVKVVVDIVANHVAQADSGASGKVHPDVIEDLRLDPDAFHTVSGNVNDNSRYDMTQKRLSGIPDLNTSNEKVQDYVKALLKECIDLGADGFRFDAAKHIELPSDEAQDGNEFASDFWPNVVDYAKSIKPDVYIYGEILSPMGTDVDNYAQYMSVTDSSYGSTVRGLIKGNSSSASLESYKLDTTADNIVTWVESHDNFASSESSALTHEQLLLGWGIIGARKDATSLYLARPEHEETGQSVGSTTIAYDELMGGPGNLLWQDKTVAEVNKFRNAYEGQSEKVDSLGSQYYVERGDDGIVIVNLSSSDANISYSTGMVDNTYTDQVNGSNFTVSNGTLTGVVPAKSVAVIYNKTLTTPEATVSLNGEEVKVADTLYFMEDTAQMSVELKNADSFSYSTDGKNYTTVSGNGSFTIGKDVEVTSEIAVTIAAKKGEVVTTETYKIVKKDPNANTVVYFDITGNESWIGDSGVYCYVKDENGNELQEYPGMKMTKVNGTSYYKAMIPLTTATIKFNEGYVSTGLDGRTLPPTVVTYGSAALKANREAGGFEAAGTMVWEDGKWQNFVNPPSEEFITECDPYALGDVDGNGKLNIVDPLQIQLQLAKIITLGEEAVLAANIDGVNDITLVDMLELQKYFAKIAVEYSIGYPVDSSSVVDPDEPTEYTIYFNNYKDWNDVYVYYWENNGAVLSSWPGDEVTETVDDNVYKVTLPIEANAVIFNNGNDGNDQSDEIIIDEENHGKMITAVKSESGDYGIWTDLGTFPEIPDSSITMYFANTGKWTTVNAYMYKDGTGKNNGAWPGQKMTLVETREDGVKIYSITFQEGDYDIIIFNNGGSGQSNNLAVEGDNKLYTPQTTSGKFNCNVTDYI